MLLYIRRPSAGHYIKMRNLKLINFIGIFFYVLFDAIQITLNMVLSGQTADEYSNGFSNIESYFNAYALKKPSNQIYY